MKKTLAIILGLLLTFVLAACQPAVPDPTEPLPTPPSETEETDPLPVVEYPEGKATTGLSYISIKYSEPFIAELYAEIIGDYECQEGFLYFYDIATETLTELCDTFCECAYEVRDHLFFSADGGKLTHYVPKTGEREIIYEAKNGYIQSIDYINTDNHPLLYLLDGPAVIRYDLLTGEIKEIGVYDLAENVIVSEGNPNLLCVLGKRPLCKTIINMETGESVHTETEGAMFEFREGIMPEEEPEGLVNPYPGVRPGEQPR